MLSEGASKIWEKSGNFRYGLKEDFLSQGQKYIELSTDIMWSPCRVIFDHLKAFGVIWSRRICEKMDYNEKYIFWQTNENHLMKKPCSYVIRFFFVRIHMMLQKSQYWFNNIFEKWNKIFWSKCFSNNCYGRYRWMVNHNRRMAERVLMIYSCML